MSEHLVINPMFGSFQRSLDDEQEVREVIRTICKEIDRLSREIMSILQVVHISEEGISPACLQVRGMLEQARDGYKKLKQALPEAKFYKYYDYWRNMTQRYCFLIALTIWLESGILATYEVVSQILGGDTTEENEAFKVELEDYLVGILMLCTELSRLALNSASRGEYSRVMQISKFVTSINAGFRLLNLKNDNLRKGFDTLKYELKKIEEVVYDLSLRGYVNKPEVAPDADDSQAQDGGKPEVKTETGDGPAE